MSDERRSALAHDLKTPLAVIAGYAELLRVREDERTRREASHRILEAAGRLSVALDDLIEQLLAAEVSSGARPPAQRTCRILLVDDDAALRSLLHATFPAEQFDVLEAADGEQALAIVEAEPLDIVVLDWDLPKIHGAAVLERLRGRHPGLPVVVLTADQTADAGGAAGFLTKPFSPVQLLDLVDRLLG